MNVFILSENESQRSLSFGGCASTLLNGQKGGQMSKIRAQICCDIQKVNDTFASTFFKTVKKTFNLKNRFGFWVLIGIGISHFIILADFQ